MTKEDIICMAREAGIEAEADTLCRYEGFVETLERFAALVIDCLTLDELREAMIESQHMVLVRSGVRIVDLQTHIETFDGEDR